MAKKPEVKVKEKVDAILEQHGAYIVNPVTGGYGDSGHGDKIVCLYGRFVAIETKAGNNKPTALQSQRLRAAYAAGGIACVINETNLGALAALCSQLAAGRKLAPAIIQPTGIDIQRAPNELRSEDYE